MRAVGVTPKVVDVTPRDGFKLFLSFANGEKRVFDVSPYLDKGIFKELSDPNYFKRVKPFFGGVRWPHEQDFGPDTLYFESKGATDDVAV